MVCNVGFSCVLRFGISEIGTHQVSYHLWESDQCEFFPFLFLAELKKLCREVVPCALRRFCVPSRWSAFSQCYGAKKHSLLAKVGLKKDEVLRPTSTLLPIGKFTILTFLKMRQDLVFLVELWISKTPFLQENEHAQLRNKSACSFSFFCSYGENWEVNKWWLWVRSDIGKI
jgi:hypothetical protein